MKRRDKTNVSMSWLDRSEIAAHFIRPGDTVCDLGAGAETLRRFLPSSVTYYPVDRTSRHKDTWVTDFNNTFDLPAPRFDAITCIGVLSHLADPKNFLRRLGEMHGGTFIVITDDKRSIPLDLYGLVQNLSVVAQMRYYRILTGTLGGPRSERPARSLHQVLLQNTPLWMYAKRRTELAVRRIRRGGNSGPNF